MAWINCNNLVWNSMWNLWKFTWKLYRNEKCHLSQIFCECFEQDHYRWLTSHIAFHEQLFAHHWIFCTIVLQFLHSLCFGRKSCIIHDFLRTSAVSLWVSALFPVTSWCRQLLYMSSTFLQCAHWGLANFWFVYQLSSFLDTLRN
jgi:hypothetical protein